MINLFRKIRKKLIPGNKVTKYLLYATGEILLVVIGILIALTVNNRSEQSKADKKIDTIFESIKLDLVNDINEANLLTKLYEESDSLQQLVLNNKVTVQDYHTNPRLRTLIMFYQAFWTEQNGYDALKRNIDNIPSEYTNVLSDLSQLYSRTIPGIKLYNNTTKEQLHATLQKWSNNYDWFQTSRETRFAANDSMIDFFLNDPKYKNDVRMYKMITINNLLELTKQYKFEAISSFFKINKAKGISFNNSIDEFKNHVNNFDQILLQKNNKNDSISRYLNKKTTFLLVKNNLNKDVYFYYRDVNGIDQPVNYNNSKMVKKNNIRVIALMSSNHFLVKNLNGDILGTFKTSSRTGYLLLK